LEQALPTSGADAASDSREAGSQASWHSQSLTMDTVAAPNGAVTTATQLQANALWGLTETTVAEKVTDGVYALRGWGIASSYAIEAPDGWIIIDTGDSTRAAAEMRTKLEQARGPQDQGCGHPAHALALRGWHRRLAG
jgi:alkyl sulfatase BDS1-like metallo-beta-lactamase superfamily hydrolase